jgi:hypothetical protein
VRRSPWLWLALALSCIQLLAFAGTDRRPPDDHDDFYTADCIPWIAALRQAPAHKWPSLLGAQVSEGTLHPRVAQTALVATLAVLGPSRGAFRAANLPFLLLLILGTALLARELGAKRPGLVALAVAVAPIVINASRKWDIQFHAAALTPIGLWLLVAALRRGGRASLGWWVALGLWQALRLHTHPIVVSDVLLTFAAGLVLLAPTAASSGVRAGARLPHWAVAVSVTGWLGLHYSGLAPDLVGAPAYNFLGYVESRDSYAATWWVAEASGSAWLGLLVQMAAEVSWVHLFPSGFLLLTVGLVALAGGWRRLHRDGGADAWLLLVPVALAIAQVPFAILAVSNKAFLNDWLFVLPGLAAAGWVAAERLLDARVGRALVAVLLVHAAYVVLVPFVSTAAGPELVERPDWYDRGPLRPFTRSSSGRHLITHHLVSRFDQPGAQLARRLHEHASPGRLARLDLYDLQFDPALGGGPGCQIGSANDAQAWSWSSPPGLERVAKRPPSAWPFVFEGFDGASMSWPDGSGGGEDARLAVVRLWVTPTDRWESEGAACRPEARLPEGWIGAAQDIAAARLDGDVERLEDPAGWLVGRVIEWDRTAAYTGSALLITRSAGEVYVDHQADLLRQSLGSERRRQLLADLRPAGP